MTKKMIRIIRSEPAKTGEIAILKKGAIIECVKSKKSIHKLAMEQGVKPIKDISELHSYWPEDEDFDSFYEIAVNSRKHAQSD